MRRSLGVSASVSLLFSYVTYAMLPVRLHESAASGLALAVVHVGAQLLLEGGGARLACTALSLVAANIAGVMTHYPREMAQRRAFLETRDCVEARLVTQRENQQQVRSFDLYSCFAIV